MRVTRQHNEDCRKLLTMMGVPVIEVRVASRSKQTLPLSRLSGLRALGTVIIGTLKIDTGSVFREIKPVSFRGT